MILTVTAQDIINLTKKDLDAIRGIVKEEVQGVVREEIKTAIDELTDKMNNRFAALALRVNQIDKRLERTQQKVSQIANRRTTIAYAWKRASPISRDGG